MLLKKIPMKNGHKSRSTAAKIKKHSLTEKQTRLVEAVLDPKVKTIAQAGRIAGYSDRQHAHRGLQSATVQNLLHKALKKAGFDESKSARILAEAGDAEHTVSVEDNREGARGERGGQAYTKITEPDHRIRLMANEQFLKIRKYIGNGHEPPKAEQHLHMNFGEKKDAQLIKDINDQIAALQAAQSPTATSCFEVMQPLSR